VNRRHIGRSIEDDIRDRDAREPGFAALVQAEFDKLELARRLRLMREASHLSQAQLAARVGTKQPAIARLESGRYLPRLDLLARVAAALGARLDVRLLPA